MMHKFRKSIAIVCALTVMLAMLSGCGSNSQNPVDVPDILGEIEDISPAETEVSNSDQGTDEKKIVSAKLGETFSCDECPYINGEMTYTVKTITPYRNLFDAGIDPNDMLKFNESGNPYYWNEELQGYTGWGKFYKLADFIDFETGEFADDVYLFIVEAEFTNINATETHWSDPYALYAPIFKLVDRSIDDLALVYNVGYFKEAGQYDPNPSAYAAATLIPGEPRTLHFGFWIYDENDSDFSKMGLTYQDDRPFKDASVFYWFNMSDVMAEVKAGME